MNNENDKKPQGGLPPLLLFVLDGEEEVNLAKFPDSANGAAGLAVPFCRTKNIPGHILTIDGPEETRN